MMARSDIDEGVIDAALAWHAALERDDADWDGYMAWLEADPRHRAAFNSVALTDRAVQDHRADIAMLTAAREVPAPPRRRFGTMAAFGGVGIAAAIALMLALPMPWTQQMDQQFGTGLGESRTIALANGTSVTLSPSSAIVVHGKDAGSIALTRGEAYFDVRHDPSRTLTITSGTYRISDIGTRFSVSAGTVFRVGVSDGVVSVTATDTADAVQVKAGHQLVGAAGALTLSPIAREAVGSWRAGRLTYSDAPIALVAADISRYVGKAVKIDPALEASHFSGTLAIGDGSKLLSDLSQLMDVVARPDGNGFILAPADR